VANNNYPQITSVTSEALQAQIRTLLPSQEGFGTDLMAQNVIVPIIDLTSAAEGSSVPQNLQTALTFDSQTSFATSNATTLLTNNTGFWRIVGTAAVRSDSGVENAVSIQLSDGLSTKDVWKITAANTGNDHAYTSQFDLVVFLSTSESISVVSNAAKAFICGSIRQIADVNGTLVNPSGFSPQ